MRRPPTLLLATDIFGHTPEMQAFARQIGGQGGSVRIVSPYGHERPRFASEMEAYGAFQAAGGVDAYARTLAPLLAPHLSEKAWDLAVGLSAGASALWVALAQSEILPRCSVLYYGSRIREHAHLRPAGDVRLIFAEREASFAPTPLAEALVAAGYDASVLPGTAHGFLNPLSPGFDEAVRDAEIARLRGLLAG